MHVNLYTARRYMRSSEHPDALDLLLTSALILTKQIHHGAFTLSCSQIQGTKQTEATRKGLSGVMGSPCANILLLLLQPFGEKCRLI